MKVNSVCTEWHLYYICPQCLFVFLAQRDSKLIQNYDSTTIESRVRE